MNERDDSRAGAGEPEGAPPEQDEQRLTRKEVLERALGRVTQAGAVAAKYAVDNAVGRFVPKVMRPPGAVGELDFLVLCTRCDECVKACPVNAILVLDDRAGVAAGTPFLDPNRYRPCVACSDAPCMPACPTGALQVIPIEESVMGFADLDRDICVAWNGTPCTRCYDACPYPEDAILLDEEGKPYVDPRHCIGCGRCRVACPTQPRSIYIEPGPRY